MQRVLPTLALDEDNLRESRLLDEHKKTSIHFSGTLCAMFIEIE